jgi:CDP-diglyceride synthetase
MTLTPVVRRIMLGAIVVLLGVAGWLTWTMPPVLQLGTLVRLVIFHGASTWVNMAAFTLAGLVGLAYVATRRDPLSRIGSAFRYLAIPWWIINTGLGLLSSRLAWNSINLAEPRLQATFWIMLAAGLVLAVDFGFGRTVCGQHWPMSRWQACSGRSSSARATSCIPTIPS